MGLNNVKGHILLQPPAPSTILVLILSFSHIIYQRIHDFFCLLQGFEARGTEVSGQSKTLMALYYSGWDRDPDTQHDIYSFNPAYPTHSKRKKREIFLQPQPEGHFVDHLERNKRSASNSEGYQDYGTCAYKTMMNELCMNGLMNRLVCNKIAPGML